MEQSDATPNNPRPAESRYPPRVSVVICTRNRCDLLQQGLDALRRQSAPPDTFEVVVVDDGSSDATGDVARRFGARVVVHPEGRGIAAARNSGLRAACGEIVAFTDDDCVPCAEWVEAILRGFENPSAQVLAGQILVGGVTGLHRTYLEARNPLRPLPASFLRQRGPVRRLWDYLFPNHETLRDGSPLYSAPTANLSIRREIFEQVGNFDQRFDGAEDEDFCRRLSEDAASEMPIRYFADAVVVHVFDSSFRSSLRRAFNYGASTIPMSRKHPSVRPIVYPVPVLSAAFAALASIFSRRRSALLWMPLVPAVGYPRWLVRAIRDHRCSIVALSYMQFAEESFAMAGEARGLVRERAR